MTTGSKNLGTLPDSVSQDDITTLGIVHQTQWTGADRPPITRPTPPKAEKVYVRIGGKQYHYWSKRRETHPPPRLRTSDWHDYNKVTRFRDNKGATLVYPDTSTSTTTCVLQAGAGFNPSGSMLTSPWTANDDIKLLAKLREKLSGSDFNAAVFLAELNPSLRLIGDTAIRLNKMYHHLRRADLAGAARTVLEGTSRKPLVPYKDMNKALKVTSMSLAERLLELRYGWQPLLSDVEGAAEFLAHRLQVPLEKVYKVRRRIEKSGEAFTYDGLHPPGAPPGPGMPYYGHKTPWTSYQAKTISIAISERPDLIPSLGLNDPLPVAWELIPFSFVADWFIPIGEYLYTRGLQGIVKGKYMTSSYTYGAAYNTYGVRCTNGAIAGFIHESGHVSAAPAMQWRKGISRVVSTTAPAVPLPTFKPLAKAATWIHAQNAVALLVASWGRK